MKVTAILALFRGRLSFNLFFKKDEGAKDIVFKIAERLPRNFGEREKFRYFKVICEF